MSDIEIIVRRNTAKRNYEAGVSVLGANWSWKQLRSRAAKTAAKEAPEAIAELLYEASDRCFRAAAEYGARAKALRLLGERALRGEVIERARLDAVPDANQEARQRAEAK